MLLSWKQLVKVSIYWHFWFHGISSIGQKFWLGKYSIEVFFSSIESIFRSLRQAENPNPNRLELLLLTPFLGTAQQERKRLYLEPLPAA